MKLTHDSLNVWKQSRKTVMDDVMAPGGSVTLTLMSWLCASRHVLCRRFKHVSHEL